MQYIDIHTHNDYRRGDIITVRNIFPGEGFATFRNSNYYSVGLHPWHLKSVSENEKNLIKVREALQFEHVGFLGECGLDKVCGTNFDEQKKVFVNQVLLAELVKKPVIVHSVKSFNEVLEIRKKVKATVPWILHGFGGNWQEAEKLVKHGFYFSFGKNLLKPDSKCIKAFVNLPLEHIFFETDEYAGNIEEIYKIGAEFKEIDIYLLSEKITRNFKTILGKNELA